MTPCIFGDGRTGLEGSDDGEAASGGDFSALARFVLVCICVIWPVATASCGINTKNKIKTIFTVRS